MRKFVPPERNPDQWLDGYDHSIFQDHSLPPHLQRNDANHEDANYLTEVDMAYQHHLVES